MVHRNGQHGTGDPIGEAALLDVVEDGIPAPEGLDQSLAERLQLMASDRASLRSITAAEAPVGLFDDAWEEAMQFAEREALLGLAHSHGDEPIPVSRVKTKKDRLMERMLDRPTRWLVGAAAGLLLAVGAGSTWIALTIQGHVLDGAGQQVAGAGSPGPEMGPIDDPIPEQPEFAGGDEPGGGESPVEPDLDTRIAQAGPDAEVDPPDPMELLLAGRLALRVVPADDARGGADPIALLDGLRGDRGSAMDTWTLAGAAPKAMADAMPLPRVPVVREEGPIAVASPDGPPDQVSGVGLVQPVSADPPARIGVWVAQLEPRDTALASLVAGLERGGPGGRACGVGSCPASAHLARSGHRVVVVPPSGTLAR